MSVRPSALKNLNFEPDSISNDEAAIDPFNFSDTFLCPLTIVLFVPLSATEDWAHASLSLLFARI